ncbi:MAG: glycosyltransferase [Parabacteroides sp.]|nr:glycosyltransferase [Parabacteroides sp.]
MDRHLNIIAFNIPWPANYGGIIDVYYKMKALHECGVKIILHCFEYERAHASELEAICEKVYYYKRHTGLRANMTLLPYNVYSRKHPELIANLLKNDYPILFEGLHCCYYIQDPRLRNRKKIYREANIEHDYYFHLARAEKHPIRKSFFLIEAWRFRRYQKILRHADLMIAVSTTDADYLRHQFPDKQVEFMPCFHTNDQITVKPGSSDFILYHGKLSVAENTQAALFLIQHVFSKLNCRCIIAGMDPPASLSKAAAPYPNIHIEANPPEERMSRLIHDAQIHILITFQATGLKLKLLNSLFAGRHTVVNRLMISGSGLDQLCHIADTPDEMIRICRELMQTDLTPEQVEQRRKFLYPTYSNQYQGKRLKTFIYGNK